MIDFVELVEAMRRVASDGKEMDQHELSSVVEKTRCVSKKELSLLADEISRHVPVYEFDEDFMDILVDAFLQDDVIGGYAERLVLLTSLLFKTLEGENGIGCACMMFGYFPDIQVSMNHKKVVVRRKYVTVSRSCRCGKQGAAAGRG